MRTKGQTTEKVITQALLLTLYLSKNPGTTRKELAVIFSVSVASVTRSIKLLRSLGVEIEWDVDSREYSILDWGIFDPDKVAAFWDSDQPHPNSKT